MAAGGELGSLNVLKGQAMQCRVWGAAVHVRCCCVRCGRLLDVVNTLLRAVTLLKRVKSCSRSSCGSC